MMRVMNSIFPSFPTQKQEIVHYHHHKIEIIIPQKSQTFSPAPMTRADRIKNAIADTLIILGTLMAVIAGTALTFQTAGFASPLLPVLSNLFMPSIAAILTGFQLSKNEIRANAQMRIATGVPGITFGA